MKTFKVLILLLLLLAGQHHVSADKHMSNDIEFIPWDQVNLLLPKYSKFTVRDVLTGMEFNVQRRAGSRHADVQPLTKNDTKILKEIYQGQWSWRRRAILVLYKGHQIAASMHGMPHGAGALQNNFPGHFCIHFYGSTTHRRNSMDISHKLMIFKAAGKIYEHLQTASPYEVISAFIAGMKEDDEEIIDMVTIQNLTWGKSLSTVETIMIANMPQLPDEDLVSQSQLSVPIELDWYRAGVGRKNSHGEIHLFRFLPSEGWKIDAQRFVEDFFEDEMVE